MESCIQYVLLLSLLVLSVNVSAAGNSVQKVYACGSDVGIYIENVGWVIVQESKVGVSGVDRILSMALSLAASNMTVGYINPTDPINWCGIASARPITVLQVVR
ncbi:MAG: hypothetical protein KZQ73_00655 [Candidatus Thiodiazotropha sp. (ex Semelilucina semeliformis)]|nr:hypothetical protein [Candidatus Thiodiazotropha sp. (ex Semelilucina semeliformis)]